MTMTPADLRAWRKRLNLTQREAAEALGISLTAYSYYERGRRSDAYPVRIPKSVRLACAALALGIRDYPPPAAAAE